MRNPPFLDPSEESVSIFGAAYLDVLNFRAAAALFGAGMAMCDYPAGSGDSALLNALAAASRMIDNHCGRDFLPEPKNETHRLDLTNWRFQTNNPPVFQIVSCRVRYASDGYILINPDRVYINNQQNYCEITRTFDGGLTILDQIGTELAEPQVEVVYQSRQDVPANVRLACGYQTAHLINSGFVDKTLPANFGKLDLGGLSVNNKKGYKSSDEQQAGSLSAEAKRLLSGEIKFSAA